MDVNPAQTDKHNVVILQGGNYQKGLDPNRRMWKICFINLKTHVAFTHVFDGLHGV
jgi:hypothetical protein